MGSNSSCSVEDLKTMIFSTQSLEKKIQIRDAGRPKPGLEIVQISKSNTRDFKRVFNREIYEKHDWICGSSSSNRLFCFPCLLFGRGIAADNWTKDGVADLAHLAQKNKKT